MPDPSKAIDAIDSAIGEVTKARKSVLSKDAKQVSSGEERDYLKSVAYAWMRTHRRVVLSDAPGADLATVDSPYDLILQSTAKNAARSTYGDALKDAKTALVALRSGVLNSNSGSQIQTSQETPPDFSRLATDQSMRDILTRRWQECQKCIAAEAHMAATVMMGGLLEALFVSRANKMSDKSPLFKAKTTPIDSQTKKPLQLTEWTLRPYIDVAHELGWITKSGKEVAAVLRDYRNYIHPEKERSHGIMLTSVDSAMFWQITQLLARQLLQSA
jgi:hypothetical protein